MRSMNIRNWCFFAALLFAISASAQNEQENCFLCDEAKAIIEEHGLRLSATPVREREVWAPPKKIVTTFPLGTFDQYRNAFPGIEFVDAGSPEAAAEHIADADVLIGLCTPEIARLGINLKWIQMGRAGIDSCAQHPEFVERGTVVTNLQRLFAKPIAEHAIALMFNLSRELYLYHEEQAAGRFVGDIRDGRRTPKETAWEVNGRTMLVVGLGGIGTEIARLGNALGMRVIATRNSRREGPDFVEYVGLAHELNELAAQADVVVSTLPSTAATRNIHNAKFFAAMKNAAIFINVGRGETVDSAALVAALESGSIAGAGIDVAYPEPLPDGHPLWSAPNLVMTPHIAGSTTDGRNRSRIAPLIAENLRRYIAGDALYNEVDLERGY